MSRYFEFDVRLLGAEPPVWRRFQIRADATFRDLHDAIQDACGWMDFHLFRFETLDGIAVAGIPDDEWGQPDPDAVQVRLASFFPDSDRCTYVYDFGDGWEHNVELHRTLELAGSFHRRLVDGARAFPPEDSGGLPGYEDCVAAAEGSPAPEGLREWIGDWDPEWFELKSTRLAFDS